MNKKIIISSILCGCIGITACTTSDKNDQNENSENDTSEIEMVNEEVPAIEEESEVNVADFIKGTWSKIAQNCDAEGNNCKESPGSDWVFDGTLLTLGRVQQPYVISHDTIYIVDSPYLVTKEWGDTILLHGVAKDRYVKLVRKI